MEIENYHRAFGVYTMIEFEDEEVRIVLEGDVSHWGESND